MDTPEKSFADAYVTSIGENYNVENIRKALKEAFFRGEISTLRGNDDVHRTLTGKLCTDSSEIPPFVYPVSVEISGDIYHFADARSCFKKAINKGDRPRLVNYTYDKFLMTNTTLLRAWSDENLKDVLKSASPLPATIYSRWIASNLTQRFGLEPDATAKINVLAAAYYYGLFVSPTDEFTDREYGRLLTQINKATFAPTQLIESLVGRTPMGHAFQNLIDAIIDAVSSERIRSLTYSAVLTMLAYGWRGNHAREFMAAALEHPPTWITILYTALTESSHRTTSLAKMLRTMKRDKIDVFTRAVYSLIDPKNTD